MDRSGASWEPGSPAGGRRRGALHPESLCCTGTRMCCTEIGSKAACACSAHVGIAPACAKLAKRVLTLRNREGVLSLSHQLDATHLRVLVKTQRLV